MEQPPYQVENARGTHKLTQRRLAKILELVGHGNYVHVAGQAVGLGERTVRRYIAQGRDLEERINQLLAEPGQDPDDVDLEALAGAADQVEGATGQAWIATLEMPDRVRADGVHENEWRTWLLWQGCLRAHAAAEAFAVTSLKKHFADSPHAVIAFLERRHPEGWRRRDRLEVETSKAGEEAERDRQVVDSPEADAAIADALRATRPGLPQPD